MQKCVTSKLRVAWMEELQLLVGALQDNMRLAYYLEFPAQRGSARVQQFYFIILVF